jgi:hypothetical protein
MLEQRLESPFHAHYSPADHLLHLHDFRLVWASEIQRLAPVDRDSCELRHCFGRMLIPRIGESNRTLRIR